MTITPGIAKRLREYLKKSEGMFDVVEARFLLQKLEPRRSLKPRTKRPSSVAKEEKRKARNERMAEIREQVMTRANWYCELCPGPALYPASEVHHMISGSGNRRTYESPLTCAAVCEDHHRALHRNDEIALNKLLNLATSLGQTYAAHCIRRRLDKLATRRVV